MEFNIEVRKKQLQSLDQYITSSKDKVQSILDYLGWNGKKMIEKEPDVTCSLNPGHIVAMKSANVHLKNCFMKTSGYEPNEIFLSEPINDPSSSIKIDLAKKIEVLNKARQSNQRFRAGWNGQDSEPMTSDRLFTTYTTDERSALYDYCVQNTEGPPTPDEVNMQLEEKKEEKFLTPEELLAKERDAKRRRIKYKSVHTGRSKSHTEIIREVIENQIEQYRDYLASKTETNKIDTADQSNSYQNTTDVDLKKEVVTDAERPSSSVSRHSNHSGSSRIKKEYSKPEKTYKNHNNEGGYKRDHKENGGRYDYRSRYDRSPHKEIRHDRSPHKEIRYDRSPHKEVRYNRSPHKEIRRYKDLADDYRHARERKERYHKSERRY